MNKILVSALSIALLSSAAFADEKPSDAEAAKIKEALTMWGCEGGTYEKEAEASGIFEIDDAKCHGAQYDLKLDANYKVTDIDAD